MKRWIRNESRDKHVGEENKEDSNNWEINYKRQK